MNMNDAFLGSLIFNKNGGGGGVNFDITTLTNSVTTSTSGVTTPIKLLETTLGPGNYLLFAYLYFNSTVERFLFIRDSELSSGLPSDATGGTNRRIENCKAITLDEEKTIYIYGSKNNSSTTVSMDLRLDIVKMS